MLWTFFLLIHSWLEAVLQMILHSSKWGYYNTPYLVSFSCHWERKMGEKYVKSILTTLLRSLLSLSCSHTHTHTHMAIRGKDEWKHRHSWSRILSFSFLPHFNVNLSLSQSRFRGSNILSVLLPLPRKLHNQELREEKRRKWWKVETSVRFVWQCKSTVSLLPTKS